MFAAENTKSICAAARRTMTRVMIYLGLIWLMPAQVCRAVEDAQAHQTVGQVAPIVR